MAFKDVVKDAVNKSEKKETGAEPKAPEIKATPAAPEAARVEQILVPQSKEDMLLRQLLGESQKEPEVWFANQIEVDERFKSMFRLPDELCRGHKKEASEAKGNAYVWIEVSDERITRMYIAQNFIAVNCTNHPWLPRSYFSAMGAIERHGYSRHVLFYQPRNYNEKVKAASSKLAEDRKKAVHEKLENSTGPVRLEEVVNKGGGYGETPDAAPIVTDWSGNLDNDAREAYDAAE